MRTALIVSALSLVSFMGVACSDAGTSNDLSRRYNAQGTEDPNAPHDPNATDLGTNPPPNPGGTQAPGQPGDPGTPAATFDVAVSNATPQADLGMSTSLDVTVTPKAAFNAPVTLEVTGLPAGVTPTFSPATLTVAGTTPVTTSLKLDIAYTTPVTPKATPVALIVKATSGGATATANVNFKVNAQVTLNIPMNATALRSTQTTYRDEWGSPVFGTAPAPLLTQADNPIKILIKNTDSVPEEVHAGSVLRHGAGLVQPGQLDSVNRSLAAGSGTQSGYLHNDGPTQGDGKGVSFRITVNAAP